MYKKLFMAGVGTAAAAWSDDQAAISLYLAAATYCWRDSYMTHQYGGAATGFVPTYTFWSGPG